MRGVMPRSGSPRLDRILICSGVITPRIWGRSLIMIRAWLLGSDLGVVAQWGLSRWC